MSPKESPEFSPQPGGPSVASDATPTSPKSSTSVSVGTVTTTTLPPDLQALMNRLASDPAARKQIIIEESNNLVGVTVAEIRSAIANNPGHIKAREFAQGIAGLVGSKTVYVEQPDIHALVHNLEVVLRTETFNGVTRRIKSVI